MATYPSNVMALASRPSAFMPILMSFAAFTVVICTVTVFGVVHEHDEGASAHIYQLLIFGELPLLAYFIMRWVRRDLPAAMSVMALQAVALAMALIPVWYLGL